MREASINISLTSSTEVVRAVTKVKSEIEPVMTGTRTASPPNRPLSSGTASVAAIAAPVLVGTILAAAARERRGSRWLLS